MGAALLCLALRQVGFAQPVRSEPARSSAVQRADAGHSLSEEDLEVLKNLELLQYMGESDDLELLLALSDPEQ
jgi:hypothetical protein